MEYTYKIYPKALKEIRKNNQNESELIRILHEKLVKGLDTTAGNDIYHLSGNLKGYERIKLGKHNEFRLIFKKVNENSQNLILIFFFEKTENPKRKTSYPEFLRLKTKYEKDPESFYFIPIKEYHVESIENFKKFIEKDYLYSLTMTKTQEQFLENVPANMPIISYVKGVPGSGKTVLGEEASAKLILHNIAVLIIVPNYWLVNYYKNYLLGNNISSEKINVVDSSSSKSPIFLKEGVATIITFRSLLRNLLPESVSLENERNKAIQALEKKSILNIFTKFNSYQEILDFYNAFFDIENNQIANVYKDALSKEYKEKIDQLEKEKNRIKNILTKNSILTRKEIAKNLFENLMELEESPIASFMQKNKSLFLVIDEIQDLIYEEWIGFVKLALNGIERHSNIPKIRLLLLGDEKQRVNISGFSWTFFKNKIKDISKAIEFQEFELKENFRVTKQIARFVKFIDENTEKNKARYVTAIKEEDCKFSKKKINILRGDLSSIEKALEQLKGQITKDQKAIVITDNSLKTKNKNIELLQTYEAKGTEHENVFLLNPFKMIFDKNGHFVPRIFLADENYKLYTMITRSKNMLTLLLNEKEYEWFSKKYVKSYLNNDVILYPPETNPVKKIKEIIESVGLEKLSLENLVNTLINKIENTLNTKHSLELFNELNRIILDSFQNAKAVVEITPILKDYHPLNKDNLNLLNKSIKSIEDIKNRKKLLLFWYLYNDEFVKAARLAKGLKEHKLYNEIKILVNNKYSQYLLQIYEIIDNNQAKYFPSKFHEELFNYFNTNFQKENENFIILNFHKNKLENLVSHIKEVL